MPKTTPEKQKKKAVTLFNSGNFQNAFETLFALDINDALAYFERKKWFENSFFWNDFLTDSSWFNKLLNGTNGERFIYLYYAKSKIKAAYFEHNLASVLSNELIRVVRRTKAFLDPDRVHDLTKLNFSENDKPHQLAWAKFYQDFVGIAAKIQRNFEKLGESKIETDLAGCVIWLEEQRFNKDDQETNLLAITYSYFIEHYFNDLLVSNYVFNATLYYESFYEILGGKRRNPLSNYLNALHQFTNFKTRFLDSYAFDDNCIPLIANNQVQLRFKNQGIFDEWKKDEGRYWVVKHVYEARAAKIVVEMEEEGTLKIPKGRLPEDEELNRTLTIIEYGAMLFINELQLSQFECGNRNISYQPLLELFNGYIGNLKDRYERHMLIESEKATSFKNAFEVVFKQGQELDIIMIPDFLLSVDEFVARSQQAIPGIRKTESEDLVDLFSYEPNLKKRFDFLAPTYNVWHQPFLKLKNHIFCPTFLLARNSLYYPFAQVLLKNNHQTKLNAAAKEMENKLANMFKQLGWQAEQLSAVDPRNKKGDVDVLIESEQSIVLIQLKRSFFRTELEEAYNEIETSTRKAARQLNEAEPYYVKQLESQKKSKSIHKWIVSTSFENLYHNYNGALKLNYFEIIQSFHVSNFDSLEDWIKYMEGDLFFKETAIKYQELLGSIGEQ